MASVKFLVEGVSKTILSVSLEKQGERGIDQIKVDIPGNMTVGVNDNVLYIQDILNVTNLSAIYNLQGSVKDESGNNNHGIASNITFGTDSWEGKAAVLNGTNGKITIADSTTLDFSGNFNILM